VTRYLLDSDAVIDRLNAYHPTVELLARLVDEGNLLATNPVVIAEVYAGLAPEQRPAAAIFVDELLFLPVDPNTARQAGELRYTAARRGIALSIPDTLIAATALAYGAGLVTGNVQHYPQPGLMIVPLPGR